MSYTYKVRSHVISLTPDPSLVAVSIAPGAKRSVVKAAFAVAGLAGPRDAIEVPGEAMVIIPKARGADPGYSASVAMKSLSASPAVNAVSPVFTSGADKIVLSDRIIIGFDGGADRQAIAARHQLELIREGDDSSLYRAPPAADIFATVNAVAEVEGVRFAEPDLVTLSRRFPARADYETMLSLNNPPTTGQYAAALTKADRVWAQMSGDRGIKIAILDLGVDTTHQDLRSAIVATYDAVDDDHDQEPNTWDSHGTACAGLAGATGAVGAGVHGFGKGCGLIAVRIGEGIRGTNSIKMTFEQTARGIRWAVANGADILSNSWSGGQPSNDVINALEEAATRGRGGRGAVVLFASGNDYSAVDYPANLSFVIAIGASNQFDESKTPSSADGERWGSNYGPEIAVVAPGVRNLTTDNRGAAGNVPGDYDSLFNGTSSSTPIVAGACGLMLSANPALTAGEVKQILMDTADKVGNVSYPGGRNDQMGAGRVNFERAVEEARRRAAPQGPRPIA